MSNILPLLYHPTSVLCLDDDRSLLEGLFMQVDQRFLVVMEQNPHSALDYLKSHCYSPRDLMFSILTENEAAGSMEAKTEIETYDVNSSMLCGNLKSSDRFKKIQVVLVDRHIPGMDGLEFCRLVKEQYRLPVKLILLTGATTVDEAIVAFNEGKIDAFIQKRALASMMNEINQKIISLAWKQFYTLGQEGASVLSCRLPHFGETEFCSVFQSVYQSEKIVEFYLYDRSGSFLMITRDGLAKLFLVRLPEDFRVAHELAEGSDASPAVLQGLRERRQFPFTQPSERDYSFLVEEEWDAAMVKMSQVPGKDIFYSMVDLPNQNICSLDDYLNSLST